MPRRLLVLLVLASGCVSVPESTVATTAMPIATAVSMPSELPPGAALMVVRNTLRRSGWPVAEAPGAQVTDWRATDAGPVRLYATAAEVVTDTSASTAVQMWAEVETDGAATPVVEPGRAWTVAARAFERVRDEVRYARL